MAAYQNSWYYASLPSWMKSDPGQQPFHSVLQGKPMQSFNPGGAFGTNAGQGGETLPSYQRWNRLAPSEQQGYQGYLQDSLGVNSNDVMDLMQKLRPGASFGGQAPRWTF